MNKRKYFSKSFKYEYDLCRYADEMANSYDDISYELVSVCVDNSIENSFIAFFKEIKNDKD